MSYPTAVQRVFDEFCRDAGFTKKSGTWYRRGDEIITMLTLQKSNYSVRYYVNVDLWFAAIDPATFPKHHHGHVNSRADHALDPFLTLDDADDPGDPAGLRNALDEHLLPVLAATATLADLRSDAGRAYLRKSGVRAGVRELIDG